jgi:alpha-mannosidase
MKCILIFSFFSSYHFFSIQSDTEGIPQNVLNVIDQYDEREENVIAGHNNRANYPLEAIKCVVIGESNATIKTVDTFAEFKFDDEWVKKRQGIWQDDFENRYEELKNDKSRPPLKVFILPHSHTDPGWLKTFRGYFEDQTKSIISTMVKKLTEYKEMRFVWTEISFLDLWWQSATFDQKEKLKSLVNEGRLEIMTGGWVMTDEANVHLYAMLDQLIEGHQWMKSNLNVTPKVGWSLDPFGQGSTVPHLLAKSGFEGAIIQRIHYSWKEVSEMA